MPNRDHSFPKERRLRKSAEFDAVMQSARGASDGTIVVFARPLADDQPSRLGLAVGRKVGKAVVRNRAKRRLREAFRLSEALKRGVEMVVVVNSDAVNTLPLPQLMQSLQELAQKSIAKGPKKERPR